MPSACRLPTLRHQCHHCHDHPYVTMSRRPALQQWHWQPWCLRCAAEENMLATSLLLAPPSHQRSIQRCACCESSLSRALSLSEHITTSRLAARVVNRLQGVHSTLEHGTSSQTGVGCLSHPACVLACSMYLYRVSVLVDAVTEDGSAKDSKEE
jgi:hypothetical protein